MARLLMERRSYCGSARGGRLWVEIPVTRKDLAGRINARIPVAHRFTGMWYGTDATNGGSFGKILPREGAIVVGAVGRNPPPFVARRLGAPDRHPIRPKRRVDSVERFMPWVEPENEDRTGSA